MTMFIHKLGAEDVIWGCNEPKGEEGNKNPLTVESVNNHIYFYSDVNSDRCLALMKEIRNKDEQFRNEYISRSLPKEFPMIPIWLHINSPGGGLFSAFAVADQIKKIKTPVYSIVEGYSASAATVISMSCAKRYIQPNAFMLIHQLSSFMWGKYEEMKDDMHLCDMAMDTLISFYKDNSNLDEKKIKELLKRDSWFSTEKCIEMGLADSIYE